MTSSSRKKWLRFGIVILNGNAKSDRFIGWVRLGLWRFCLNPKFREQSVVINQVMFFFFCSYPALLTMTSWFQVLGEAVVWKEGIIWILWWLGSIIFEKNSTRECFLAISFGSWKNGVRQQAITSLWVLLLLLQPFVMAGIHTSHLWYICFCWTSSPLGYLKWGFLPFFRIHVGFGY